jgi:hypothetical protein
MVLSCAGAFGVVAPATAFADDGDWKVWMAFLGGGITRWAALSSHTTEMSCRRSLDLLYEIDAEKWLKSRAKGSLEEFDRCFPGQSPPGPVIGPSTKPRPDHQ